MRYLAALKSGVPAETASLDFVMELVECSNRNGNEPSWDLICDFVNDTLASIGLPTDIRAEEIKLGQSTYVLPIQVMQTYVFHYNVYEFGRVEKFLTCLCLEIKQHQDKFNVMIQLIDDEEAVDLESPLEFLMEMLAIWFRVNKRLQSDDTWKTAQMFEEPLSRINYHLFLGMHDVRKTYPNYPFLDSVCQRLYKISLEGLRYTQSHDMIFNGLFATVSNNLELFKNDAKDLFYEALLVKSKPATTIKLYQSLQTLLEETADDNRLNILAGTLIKIEMLEVYFTTFVTKQGNHKNIINEQEETLKLLNILQSKLLTLDCFSRDFMESILHLVLQKNENIAELAGIVYVNMLKRMQSDASIFKHILEFFVKLGAPMAQLKNRMLIFYQNFPFMRNVHNYLEIIKNDDTTEIMRLLTSQLVVVIVEIISGKTDAATNYIEPLLLILPEFLEHLSCQRSFGILLNMFNYASVLTLRKETIDNFIHFAVGILMNLENNFEYPLLMNICSILQKCLSITNEWHLLEQISGFLTVEFQKIIKKLPRNGDKMKTITKSNAFQRKFRGVLERINILMKLHYEVFDFLLGLIDSLQQYVLHNDLVKKFNKENSFIDLYALEICVSCCRQLAKRESSNSITSSACFIRAKELAQYFEIALDDIEKLWTLNAFRIKVYFCGLVNLYCSLPLTLSTNGYHNLTQILIGVILYHKRICNPKNDCEELQQVHPHNSMEYLRVMFHNFEELHKYPHMQIKSNVVWKLCIHYGRLNNHFNEELMHLLITLATYRLDIYKHIIAVLIFNLYKQQPALHSSTIILILKEHKRLIDNEIQIESPKLLKVHIVLLVLQIIQKALSVQTMQYQHNRLQALRNLGIFMEGLDLSALEAKQPICQELAAMGKHILTTEERILHKQFKQALDTF